MRSTRRLKYFEMQGPGEHTLLIPRLDSFDDALPYVGDFGRYQFWLLAALLPFGISYSILYFSQIFLTLVPREHWCRVDELLGPYPSPEDRRKIAVPANDKYPYYDTCSRWDLNFSAILGQTTIEPNSSLWQLATNNRTVKCDRWEYDFSQIPYPSIGAELDWVCDRGYLISTAQAIFYTGSILGGFLFGWIADNKGRIPALWLCTACGVAGSVATASADSFWSFALCRFVTGLAFDNVISIPLIIVVEYMGVSRRTVVVNIAFGLYFGVGSTLLPWLAYYIADWRLLSYVSAAPLAFCLVTPWILPESARWYVSNRRSDKVIEKLKRIASVNDVRPDPHFYDVFYRNLSAKEGKKETATLLDLFRTPRLARITIILTLFWSLILLAFDGHVYSLKLLESSVFLSFSLACATELPAALLLTMVLDRWGRRFCGFVTMALTTAFTIAEILVESGAWKLVMSIFARFTLNMAANVGLQYAAELLPTPVRAQGVGMIHIFGILAHSVAPYIIDTVEWWSDMPMAIISAIAFLCASLVLFLPETLGHDLPQTLQQGEDFGKNQRFWSSPCCSSCYANDDDDQDNDGVKGDVRKQPKRRRDNFPNNFSY
ncbi:carcinine transporter-like [Trichogramma pretiosum]|uniref:carcinine transporter-like n=1 Tax=Trichogramma pretiosum TaxID=7493 RepID=UPI0006C945A3|nr:carcinine transporter-like [Trichogramma pretiosum]